MNPFVARYTARSIPAEVLWAATAAGFQQKSAGSRDLRPVFLCLELFLSPSTVSCCCTGYTGPCRGHNVLSRGHNTPSAHSTRPRSHCAIQRPLLSPEAPPESTTSSNTCSAGGRSSLPRSEFAGRRRRRRQGGHLELQVLVRHLHRLAGVLDGEVAAPRGGAHHQHGLALQQCRLAAAAVLCRTPGDRSLDGGGIQADGALKSVMTETGNKMKS